MWAMTPRLRTFVRSNDEDLAMGHHRGSVAPSGLRLSWLWYRVPNPITGLPPCATEDGPSGAKTLMRLRPGGAVFRSTGRKPCERIRHHAKWLNALFASAIL